MRKVLWRTSSFVMIAVLLASSANGQDVYDVFESLESDEGAWSDIAATTWTAPLVADGSITIDGNISGDEYGGFEGYYVTPGAADGTVGNAWILGFPNDAKEWDGQDDSSFTFWTAHDSEFLYIGVDVKDDEVISNDPNPQFWKDDAIEIIVDANNDRANVNTDQAAALFNDYGGHNYVNYEGRFSRWDEEFEEPLVGWANAVDWEYGENGQIWGVGGEKEGGWSMEVKFHKSQFEDPDGGGAIEEGDRIGFNIGMDDDDGADLALQYWAANRLRPLEFDEFALDDGETIDDFPPEDFDWVIDAAGRLSHGGTGELIFGGAGLSPKEQLASITDPAEREAFVHDVLGTWMGDANCDGEFNSSDLVTVFQAGLFETGQEATWEQGDFDGDGVFGSGDFVVAFGDGGYELGPRGAAQSVPEPSSIVLLGLGFLGLARIRRRM